MARSVSARGRDVSADSVEGLKQRLLNKLASRMRTSEQLRKWSIEQGYAVEMVASALADLERAQLVDDLAYANAVVRSKSDLAAPELRRRLLAAGVREQDIVSALQSREIDDEQVCEALVAKLWSRMSKLNYEVAERRILSQLKRRGFDFGVAMRTFRRIAGER